MNWTCEKLTFSICCTNRGKGLEDGLESIQPLPEAELEEGAALVEDSFSDSMPSRQLHASHEPEEVCKEVETQAPQLACAAATLKRASWMAAHDSARQDRSEAGTIEGLLERRGLRAWNVVWAPMFVSLNVGDGIVHIYDDDDQGRTLHATISLTARLRVVRFAPMAWRVQPEIAASMDGFADELPFMWRAPDVATTERWTRALEAACRNNEVASSPVKIGCGSPASSISRGSTEATSPKGNLSSAGSP